MRRLLLPLVLMGLAACSGGPAGPEPVDDLPLVALPAASPGTGALVVFLSGDGGWAPLDQAVAQDLAAAGHGVVGLSSLRYFWKARTPESAARDLGRILRHYLAAWGERRVVLVGFSFGADVLPFLVDRLPEGLRRRVSLVALLGMSASTAFEFHLSQWLGGAPGPEVPVVPELTRLKGMRLLCVYGTLEATSPCRTLDPSLARVVALPGDHHFGGDYRRLAEVILGAMP